jgi:hypothetical protein
LATQFQNARGDWICATQETATCRKRLIYTASCPTTTDALSWARVALYLADDTLELRRPQHHHSDDDDPSSTPGTDTCTTIRNSVASSRSSPHPQQRRRPATSQTCQFHFQLPCSPIVTTRTGATPVAESSSAASTSWSSSSTKMLAI